MVVPVAMVRRGMVCGEGEGLHWRFEAQEEAPDEVPLCEGTCRNCSELSLQSDMGWLADDVSAPRAGGPKFSI